MRKQAFALLLTITLSTAISPGVQSLYANGAWYVKPDGNDLNACTTPATACRTLEGVMDKLTAGDTVYTAVGVYSAQNVTDYAVVEIQKSVAFSGGWNDTFQKRIGLSIIDGQNAHTGIRITDGASVSLDHFVIQNGNDFSGGGIAMWESSLTLNHSAIRDNVAYATGGGIYADSSTLNINNSSLTGNRVSFGDGGGIRHAYGNLVLNNVTITDNQASGGGGGLSVTSISASIRNSTLNNNIVFMGNGGGLYVIYSNIEVKNSILAGNFTYDYNAAGNQTPNCYVEGNAIESAGYNIVGDLTGCSFTSIATDQLDVDPKLGSLEGLPPYHPLLATSPAINGGDPTGCTDHLENPLFTDQRGFPRVGRCDIGAYEASLSFVKEVTGNAQPGAIITYTLKLKNLEGITTLDNVIMTDTLPISVTYVPDSLVLTQGSGQVVSETLQWTGSVVADTETRLSFQAIISDITPTGVIIPNIATTHWADVSINAAADVDLRSHIFLPLTVNHYTECEVDLLDDFSNPNTGWPITDDDYVRYEYLDGEYRVLAQETGYMYLVKAPTCPRQNYIVETDVHWANVTGNSYGLIFGVADDFSSYYLFDMNADLGVYRLYYRDPSGLTEVVPPTSSTAILGGTAVNHLKVTRNSGWFSLYINGTVVNNLLPDTGPTPPASSVGLIVSPYSNMPNADARFDNFNFVSLPDSATINQNAANCLSIPTLSHRDSISEIENQWLMPIDR